MSGPCLSGAAPDEPLSSDALQDLLDRGGTVVIPPGTHAACGYIMVDKTTIVARGAHLSGAACGGKAALVVQASNIVIDGLECSNVKVPDRNGACIRAERGRNLTLRNVHFHDNENGILGGGEGDSVLLIEHSMFERNGHESGQAHGLYVWFHTVILRHTTVGPSGGGHLVKSGAAMLLVEDSVLDCQDGVDNGPRAVDAYNGGSLVMVRSQIKPDGCQTAPIGWQHEQRDDKRQGILVVPEGTKISGGKPDAIVYD
jgi:hypothetical protein